MHSKTNMSDERQIKERHHKWTIMALDTIIVIALFGLVWLGINIVQKLLLNDRDHVYNCSIAEIHPDYTPAMRLACRKQFEKETK
jgi:hypothetical protein